MVDTTGGFVRGEADAGVLLFKDIPYAAPPEGAQRWRPPGPAPHWSGVRDATQFGAICPQPAATGDAGPEQSEDCLTLNIATPETGGAKAPVMFYIHGGAFFVGSGREVLEGVPPALVEKGVVIVAPNYRLGRLGFFAHPALTNSADGEGVANYWLMDLVAALEWVRDNVSAFGGDPDNITLLGCSAGGSSVNSLMTSPRTRGLFHKAVTRSGGGLFNATRALTVAEEQGLAFAERAGAPYEGDDTLKRLRALSVAEVLAADPGPPNFGATLDGTYLTTPIGVAAANGSGSSVPHIAGSTSNEASIYGLMGFDETVLAERFDVHVDELRPEYEADGPISDDELLRQVQTDFIFTSASLGMASLAAFSGAPSWSYHYDYVSPTERNDRPGADHCADMKLLFAGAAVENNDDAAIADLLQDQIIQFMSTGSPNGHGLPDWPPVTAPTLPTLVVSERTRAIEGFRSRQMQVWFEKWDRENTDPVTNPHEVSLQCALEAPSATNGAEGVANSAHNCKN